MKLSESIFLKDLCVTTTGLPNKPSEAEIERLLYLAALILEPIKKKYGRLLIHSAFRSEEVNAKVGGSKTSQHRQGAAADFSIPGVSLVTVYDWCRMNLGYGQLILEKKGGIEWQWIHISLPRLGAVNMVALTYDGKAYQTYNV